MCLLQRSDSNNNGKEKAAFREGVAFQNDCVNDSLCISCQRMAANHREAKYGTSGDASGVQELIDFHSDCGSDESLLRKQHTWKSSVHLL